MSSKFNIVHTFETVDSLTKALGDEFVRYSNKENAVHISLSGGSTPKALFQMLASAPFATAINWSNLHFWWGDERCVPAADEQSNFGEAQRILFRNVNIPQENLHRVRGEDAPETEVLRYAEEIKKYVSSDEQGNPIFDWILLGMGDDGHTASIFPDGIDPTLETLTALATHPTSGQIRVSKTLNLINNAQRISFLVTGSGKKEILQGIQAESEASKAWPATWIQNAEWWMDSAAASYKEN